MNSPAFDYVDAIAEHSAAFAAAADGNLDAEVENCAGWTVADLVAHLTGVQWFWATIAEQRLASAPDFAQRPATAPREEMIATFESGAEHLTKVLRAADGADTVWTWAPGAQHIAFITRHQVQEAAVHHWDAANAAGRTAAIATPVAVDSITEFLTYSVSSEADPAEPVRPALDGRFTLRCSDADAAWTITDGPTPGTVTFVQTSQQSDLEVPAVTATASDLLLWLYGRVEVDPADVRPEVLERFRALTFTD